MRVRFLLVPIVLWGAENEKPADRWTASLSMKVRPIGAVTPSPDGSMALWTETVAVTEGEKSEFVTHIFLARASGSVPVQLTRGDKSATAPQFTPSGEHVLFASERSGKRNLYRIPVAGGEAEQLTDWKGSLGAFAVSPDGNHVAFLGRDEDKDLEKRRKEKLDFKILDDSPNNDTLWIFALDASMPAKPKRVVQREYHVAAFDWSPESTRIAFEHRPRSEADYGQAGDLSEVEVSSGAVREVAASPGAESQPRYSPDGRYLAFTRSSAGRRVAGERLVLLTRGDGSFRELAPTSDQRPVLIDWMADSRSMLYAESSGVRGSIFRMPLDGPPVPLYRPDRGTLQAGRLNQRGTHVGLAMQSPDEPPEAFLLALGESPRRVSAANTALPRPPLGRTEVIRWKAQDGLEIEGLLTYPAGPASGSRVPLILNIHGGPSGVFTETFIGSAGLYPIASFASKGYAVLRPNPRGSTAYGPAFREQVIEDWGGRDFQDLMAGVDHVIRMGVADPDRMAVMGWSYGGYMTAWTVTQTNRFKAAAVGAGITNHVSMYGTQDIPSVYEDYFGGTPWERPEVYARSSPLHFARNIRTPTLLLHGENDARVPPTQALEFYRAVKRQGIPARMILYPRQPHGPTEPKFQQHIMEQHLEWAGQFLGGK